MALAARASSAAVLSLLEGGPVVDRSPQATRIAASGAVYGGCSVGKKTTRGIGHVQSVSTVFSRSVQNFPGAAVPVRAVAMQDSLTDEDSESIGEIGFGQRELKDYPPGLQRYETMAVLRPDISEEQRLALTQRYEETIIAGGGLDVEMFNRGMQPLAFNIKTKNMSGVSSRYLDGIYLLFTYVTKPESQLALQKKLNADDDIIRSTTFRLKV